MYIKPKFMDIEKKTVNKQGKTQAPNCIYCFTTENLLPINEEYFICVTHWLKREFPEHDK